VIENKPGGDGIVAINAFVGAQDDHVLLYAPSSSFIGHPYQHDNLPYNPGDLAPIARISNTVVGISVPASLPAKSLKDVVEAARAKPGELSMASIGPGSTFQTGFATFTAAAKINMTFVPYAGSAPVANAVLGQHVTAGFTGYAVVAEQLKAGALRPLAVATLKRIEPLPDVPTFDESGFKKLEVDNWFAVLAPAKTPKPVVDELGSWFAAALRVPEVKAKLALQGLYPVGMCGAEFADYTRQRYDEYGKAISAAGLKPQ
jgi:tripartite-type tricarboxylate transporter receptor subunit TctC